MFVLSRTLQSLLLVLVYFWCLCVGGSVWFVNCIFWGGTKKLEPMSTIMKPNVAFYYNFHNAYMSPREL